MGAGLGAAVTSMTNSVLLSWNEPSAHRTLTKYPLPTSDMSLGVHIQVPSAFVAALALSVKTVDAKLEFTLRSEMRTGSH